MNVLFVTGHPAQVHNFRLVREKLIQHGHQVHWLTTPKDIATDLLDRYSIPYNVLKKPTKGKLAKLWTWLSNVIWEVRFIRKNRINLAVTRACPYTTFAAKLTGINHIALSDTEIAEKRIGFFSKHVDTMIVANSFWLCLRDDEIRYAGNTELFYLHPNQFKPLPVWEILGLKPHTPFAIVRFVKWDAWHDVDLVGGFSLEQKRELIQRIKKYMRVFISSESELPSDLEPYRIQIPIERMHDVQAAASLFVGESATMASESVCLGTPAIYIDEVGRGYTDEEAREGLLWMFRPVPNRSTLKEGEPSWISGGVEECISKAEELASAEFDRKAYALRHAAWLSGKIDPTAFLTWFIENYPHSVEETKNANATGDTEFWKRFK